jgi:hypothetical protein
MNFANLGANLGLRTAPKSTAAQRRAGRNAAGTTLRIGTALASGLVVVLSIPAAHAQTIPSGQSLPTGGVASAGATISTQATAVGVDLHNTSQLISWNTFDVATGNTVSFSSTDDAGATFTAPVSVVNRVVGTGNGGVPFSSAIYGTIDAAPAPRSRSREAGQSMPPAMSRCLARTCRSASRSRQRATSTQHWPKPSGSQPG